MDPAVFLAKMLDLHASVDLARALSGPASRSTARRDPAAGFRLRELVRVRLEEIEEAMRRPFDEPFHRRSRLPTAVDLVALLEDAGGGATRSPRGLESAAETAFVPFAELTQRAASRVRADARALRRDIAPLLAAVGPATAQLERLDWTLLGATERKRDDIVDQLVPALGRSFVASFVAAVDELPLGAGPADLKPWFDAGGWLVGEVDRARRVVGAIFAHEKTRLMALGEMAVTEALGALHGDG